jgi:hypothetical protein
METTATTQQLAFEASTLFQGRGYCNTFMHNGEVFTRGRAQYDSEGDLLFIRYTGSRGTTAIVFND